MIIFFTKIDISVNYNIELHYSVVKYSVLFILLTTVTQTVLLLFLDYSLILTLYFISD